MAAGNIGEKEGPDHIRSDSLPKASPDLTTLSAFSLSTYSSGTALIMLFVHKVTSPLDESSSRPKTAS